jgi:hypothetical protein
MSVINIPDALSACRRRCVLADHVGHVHSTFLCLSKPLKDTIRSTEGSVAIGRCSVDHGTAPWSNQFVRRLYSLPLQGYAKTAHCPSLGKRLCRLGNLGVAGARSCRARATTLACPQSCGDTVDALGPVCVMPKPMPLGTGATDARQQLTSGRRRVRECNKDTVQISSSALSLHV